MAFLDLSILNVLPEVVADGSEGGMHLYAEITSESYGSFILGTFLFTGGKTKKDVLLLKHSDKCLFKRGLF